MTVDALLNLALLSMLALVSGLALMEIRDGRLYRAEFGTFEEYCNQRWGWERAHAYRLIDAAQVVENVSNWRQSGARCF